MKAVLKADEIEQGQSLRRIEFGDQIHIRGGLDLCSASVRAVQMQMHNPGSAQFRLMLLQLLDDLVPTHTITLP